MHKDQFIPLAEEAIRLELQIGKLYKLFYHEFKEDNDLWWQLTLEENNHAALLRSALESFVPSGHIPAQIVSPALEALIEINVQLSNLLKQLHQSPPTREEAFSLAIQLEESAGEAHYQKAMTQQADDILLKIFQQLNEQDKHHLLRLQNYMQAKGITLGQSSASSLQTAI